MIDTTTKAARLTEAQKRSVTCPTCHASAGKACRGSRIPGANTLGGGWGGPPDLDRAHDARRAEALRTLAPAPRVATVIEYKANIRHERGTVTLAPRTETGLQPCPGEAHTNAFIDHCMVCLGGTYGKVIGYAPLTLAACVAGFAVPVNETRRGDAFEAAEKAGEVVLVHVEEKIGRKGSCSFFAYVSVATAKGLAARLAHSKACMTTYLLSGDPKCPACGDEVAS